MTGEMRRRYTGVHYEVWIDTGGKYLNRVIICGWKNPTKTTNSIYKVTCPDCENKIQESLMRINSKPDAQNVEGVK